VTTQPPEDPRGMTWVDDQNLYWRIERIGGRWQLSLYRPTVESWHRIGSYPSKSAAIDAAREEPPTGMRP
jgi:hypothetical protein